LRAAVLREAVFALSSVVAKRMSFLRAVSSPIFAALQLEFTAAR